MTPELQVLPELLLLAGASLVVLLLFQRLRLPAITGFLVAGVLIGPGGFGLVRDAGLVRTLAEFGLVLLLFTVGLEFSLVDLRRLGRATFLGATLQVVFTTALVAGGLAAFGLHPARALFFGMLVAMSSTAVVLRLLTDRLELESPHGRLTTGVVVFQDLLVVPFTLLAPALARWLQGGLTPVETGLGSLLGSLALMAAVVLLFAGAQRAVSWLLRRASQSRSREAFLFGVLLVALGSASLASWAGTSLALGAFLAGLMLAESELRPQIAADVVPFRDTLASVFFIAIGMSFEPRVLLAQPLLIAASTLGLVAVKMVAALGALLAVQVPLRVALASSLALAQVGEFSFVLAQAGTPLGLVDAAGRQAFLAGALFSLMLTPFLVARAPSWALALEMRFPRLGAGRGRGADAFAQRASALLSGHVVIAGLGLNGRNVARVLRKVHLPHVVVDLDPESLRIGVGEGSQGLLGDITNPLIQRQAGLSRARVLVLALSDPTATRQACRVARSLSREVFIIVRTRYVAEIDQLYALGANQVIPEEFETSIEIFTAVLREFHVPGNVIQAQIALLRQERYSLLRGRKFPTSVVEQLDAILQQGTTDTFLLLQQSPAIDHTLEELGLKTEGEARAVAVVRGGQAITEFPPDFRLRVGDTLVLTGTHAQMDRVFEELSPPVERLV